MSFLKATQLGKGRRGRFRGILMAAGPALRRRDKGQMHSTRSGGPEEGCRPVSSSKQGVERQWDTSGGH